jgi:hypothetical protein
VPLSDNRKEGRGSKHWDITHDEEGRRRDTKERTEEKKQRQKKKEKRMK